MLYLLCSLDQLGTSNNNILLAAQFLTKLRLVYKLQRTLTSGRNWYSTVAVLPSRLKIKASFCDHRFENHLFLSIFKILFPHLDAHWIHHCCPKIYSPTMAPPIFQASTAVLDIHALVISKGGCLAAHKANKTERPRVEMRYDEMTSKKLPPKRTS